MPTGAAYIVPFICGLWFGYVPLGFPLGLFTFLILLGTFNYLRLSKPECWLSQKFDATTDRWVPFRPPLSGELEIHNWVRKAED